MSECDGSVGFLLTCAMCLCFLGSADHPNSSLKSMVFSSSKQQDLLNQQHCCPAKPSLSAALPWQVGHGHTHSSVISFRAQVQTDNDTPYLGPSGNELALEHQKELDRCKENGGN